MKYFATFTQNPLDILLYSDLGKAGQMLDIENYAPTECYILKSFMITRQSELSRPCM